MPLAPPVIKAVFPLKFSMLFFSSLFFLLF